MKLVNLALKFSLIATLAVPSIVAADELYQVKGDSMFPRLKNGDYVSVQKQNTYNNSDIVVARQQNGEDIIKKVQDGLLVGESSYSVSVPQEKVKILGKVEETTINPKNKKVKTAKALINDSPIKDIYTGRDFVLFLHEDTSITGFGSNVNNVLGREGGTAKSTPELVSVSGPTGFERLVVGANEAYGLRTDVNTGLYKWIKIKENLNEETYSGLIKDAATPGRPSYWIMQYVITPEGLVQVRGTDNASGAGEKCLDSTCDWQWSEKAYVKYQGVNIENAVDIETAETPMLTVKTQDNSLYYVNASNNTVKLINADNANIVKMSGGTNHFLGVDNNGVLYSWGNNGNGALGIGSTTSSYDRINKVAFPDNFYNEYRIVDFKAGGVLSIALAESKITGKKVAYVWGKNDFGTLGTDEVAVGAIQNKPVPLKRKGEIVPNITKVSAGIRFMVALQDNEDGYLIWTAGLNDSGQLGGGTQLYTNVPSLIPGLTNIKNIMASNGSIAYALNSNNQMLAWGYDTRFPHNPNKAYPATFNIGYSIGSFEKIHYWTADNWSRQGPMFLIQKDTKIAYGFQDFCYSGGTTNTSTSNWMKIEPVSIYADLVPGGKNYFDNVRDVINNTYPGGALIDSNGRIWSWGHAPLSVGTAAQANANCNAKNDPGYIAFKQAHPVKMGTDTLLPDGFTQLATGYSSSVGLRNGSLWILPHGKTVSSAPINSSYAINNVYVKSVYGSYGAFYALDDNGEVWSWGTNYNGKLGWGNTNSSSVPNKINSTYFDNKKIIDVSSVWNFVLFLAEDGTVYSAGDNGWGELGNGTTVDSYVPVKVQNLKDITKIAAGPDFAMALDNQGRVWSWGRKSSGALGDNFSISRAKLSTAVGNEIPEMKIESEIKTHYLSKNGNKIFVLTGKVKEKEKENVIIKASVLGIEKEVRISQDSWNTDEYNEVIEQGWSLEWNVNEFSNGIDYQSLTMVSAEDDRGGIVEQFYSGKITVDNERPQTPQYGDTCLVTVSTGTEQCMGSNYFKMDGTNGVNKPVRLYFNVLQKSGNNKTIVKPQIKYRTKQAYGYPTTWSDWIDVDNLNGNGYYYDFFRGFQGETQIKLRGIDEAGNISDENSDYRYIIISDAGAEVKKISATFGEVENKLFNEVSFTAFTQTNSAIKSYNIKRKLVGETEWDELTPNRVAWNGLLETTYKDEYEGLLGNAKYEYLVDVENSVTVGKGKSVYVTTYPYYPANFIRTVNEEGIEFNIKQDERNRGKILYRLVLTDNQTGEIYYKDAESSNAKEEIIFNVKESDVPFSILNNSITIKLLEKGENNEFLTIVYDEKFENAPSIITDRKPPEVVVGIEGNPEKILSMGDTKVNLSLSATDNVTPYNKLEVQFSKDGTNWYGKKSSGVWEKNVWSSYKELYTDFSLGGYVGNQIIYARVKDEAGNIGSGNTSILIAQLVNRDDTAYIYDEGRERNSGDGKGPIYVNNSYVKLKVPKTGNVKEVQYSFDGVEWSPWETIKENHVKLISIPPREGKHSIMLRYKNEFGDITRVQQNNDIIKYILDRQKPDLEVATSNGTYIVKDTGASLVLNVNDNLATNINVKLITTGFQMFYGDTQATNLVFKNDERKSVFINGLKDGFNIITFEIADEAGNTNLKTIRLFKK